MMTAPHAKLRETGTAHSAVRVVLLATCAMALFGCGGVDTDDYTPFLPEATTNDNQPAEGKRLPPKPLRPNASDSQQATKDEDVTPLIAANLKATAPQPSIVDDTANVVQARKPSPQTAVQNDVPALERIVARVPRVLITVRHFKNEGPEDAIRVTYDDLDLLRVLNMEPVTDEALTLMPDWLKSLDGRRIRLRGFMKPEHVETGLGSFGLGRDNEICCFGKEPKVYDFFNVVLREGVTTDYIDGRPFDVVGMIHILPYEDWYIHGMYWIDDAIVIGR